ncbi:MAG: dihydroneopterin aldolase [Gammaproteobacteria bacterium]|nr:dihydroneopterin aldolase [Gammaproteobacteria bacterium]
MDIVFLHGLRVDTVIGVWDWERRIRQTLVLDIDIGTDIRTAAASDAIDDTLDYKAVTKRIERLADESRFQLVESLAELIAATLLDEFGAPWVRVKLNKQGAVRNVRDVGIVIERSREG